MFRRSFCHAGPDLRSLRRGASGEGVFRNPERRPLQFHRIAVFDWDGHALERITTDWNIRAMCVGADGTIYAALYDNLSRVFLGRIVPSEGEEALRR